MSDSIWGFDDLVRMTRSDDKEVRYWAVERLVRHCPARAADAVADLLLDEKDLTQATVARHLGEYGSRSHHGVLLRGFRLLRGLTPGYCLQALMRLAHPGVLDLAADALKRGDLDEPALAIIVETLAEHETPRSQELVREYIARRVELLAEPAALRGALAVASTEEIPELFARMLEALERRGTHRAGEAFRTLVDSLRIDDAGWCIRTGPSGHIELRKTIKAIESGYDCDILTTMGEATIKQLAQRIRAGNLADVVRSLADWTRGQTAKLPKDEEDRFGERIGAAVKAFSSPPLLEDVERMGHQFQQWLVGFHLSAAFAVARGHNPRLELRRAAGELDRLLSLAELETAHLLGDLPRSIALVCREDEEKAHRAQEWCLRMLEAQGPFFPKVCALETLGELRAVHFIPEVMDYLEDENSYIYGAAERALSKMGESIIIPAANRIETEAVDPEMAHSILLLLCDLGTQGAYEVVKRHFDWFMDSVGPGAAAEWVSLFGVEEMIEPLRDWLDEDPAAVGRGLLLLGAIHDVPIPEEEEIHRAIDEEEARLAADTEEDAAESGGTEGGPYVM
jgi:hypothetical protein